MKKVLIIGCGGQDGSYLCDNLLERGDCEVHGIYRRSSVNNLTRIAHCRDRIILHRADMQDGASIERVIRDVRPAEIYNEADQDHVGFSKETPQVSIDITTGAVQRLLETVLRVDKGIKVFQPISATIFKSSDKPLNETSEFAPASPYACAKLAAYYLCQHYRRDHGLLVSCGIMFNHESSRRGSDYLLQRIVKSIFALSQGKEEVLDFGGLGHKVDIGYAIEYMEIARRMLELPIPEDFVIGTGVATSVFDFVNAAYEGIYWFDKKPLSQYLRYITKEPPVYHPQLIADITKVSKVFNWIPRISGTEVIGRLMYDIAKESN